MDLHAGSARWPIQSATTAGVAAILLWSTTVAFSRTLSEQMGPFSAGAAVYLLAGLLGLAGLARKPGRLAGLARMRPRYLLVCGALFAAYMLLLYAALGLAHNRAQVLAVGLANYLWPSLTLLFALPIQRSRANGLLPAGIILSLAGSWLAASASQPAGLGALRGGADLLPVGLAGAASVCWALYSNLARRWGAGEDSAVPLFLLVCGLLFLPLRWLAAEPPPNLLAALPAVVYLALFPSWLGYRLWDRAIQRGDLILVTTLSYFTPLLSTLISLLVLGVALTPQLAGAAVLVSAGAVLARRGIRSG